MGLGRREGRGGEREKRGTGTVEGRRWEERERDVEETESI